ncbi:hypothetical protein Pla108_08860 [Botrimarina colliarenosi]|uniref:PsbP C-terminal domain-containing protein n=1 Tax=Botrimarina colliarenosi TaxID=2528001 RepID=A0A5C6AIQ7_9BACT|nr:hypothetical protein [Botrimarina colliarenosi]TWT99942.1 hypothetical protein Pla108_08860 [Botrimarina colliarenosi]
MIARLLLVVALGAVTSSTRADEAATRAIEVAEGALVFDAPADWESVTPANRIIEHEIAVPAPSGSDAGPARLTVMAAGGSVDANLARWVGQFQGTEGGADRQSAKVEKQQSGGMEITLIDVAGTYLESLRGPFGPKTPRPDYRLVGAIVETKGEGNYFFKLIGPAATVEPAVERFQAMVPTLRKSGE